MRPNDGIDRLAEAVAVRYPYTKYTKRVFRVVDTVYRLDRK